MPRKKKSKFVTVKIMVDIQHAQIELGCEINQKEWDVMSFEDQCTYMDVHGVPTGHTSIDITPNPDWYDGVDDESFEIEELQDA